MLSLSDAFVSNIGILLRKRGLTQGNLADMIGVHRQTVHRYLTATEKNRISPPLKVVERIGEALKVSPALLVHPLLPKLFEMGLELQWTRVMDTIGTNPAPFIIALDTLITQVKKSNQGPEAVMAMLFKFMGSVIDLEDSQKK